MKAIITCFVISLMISCKSVKYVPVETVKTEKEYVDRFKTDSVHVRDSVFVLVKGDTVYKDRTRTVYRDRYSRDTAYISKVDTIQVAYPVEVIKEKYHVPKSLWWLVILLAGLSVPSVLKILRKLKLIKI